MSKNITVTVTPAQQSALWWAVNTFRDEFDGSEFADAEFRRALKSLDRLLSTFPTN